MNLVDFSSIENLSKSEQAIELRKQRICNCCQAVVVVLTRNDDLYLAASGFGGGFGSGKGPCGALCGAIIAAGKNNSQKEIKTTVYSKRISERFKELCGSMICSELKGRDTGVVLCSCEDCIRNALKAYEEIMEPPITD